MVGELVVHLPTGVDHLVVDGNVEDAARTLDERALNPEFFLDLSRQTDGARLIVSLHAEFDADAHGHDLAPSLAVE